MTQTQTSSTSSTRKRRGFRQPTGGYLFVISGSAVFLGALVLGLGFRPRDPVKAIVAPVKNVDRIVSAELIEPSVAQLASIAETIKSHDTIKQTLELIGKFDGTQLDRKMTAEKFLRHFQVSVRPSSMGGRHEILLDYSGSAHGATEVVNQLATTAVQQFERKFEQPARQRQFQAQQEAAAAERKATAALRRYEQYISRLQPAIQAASELGSESGQAGTKSAGNSNLVEPDSPNAMIPNPAWRELADQQQRLTRRRSELLEQMTNEHPVIQQLDIDMTQLDQTLSQTPRLIDNPALVENSNPKPAEQESKDPAVISLAGEEQIAAETQRLRAESVAADELVVTRQAELLAASNELQAAQDGRLEVLRWAEKPAMIRGTDGITLIVAALLAWLVGSAVASRGVPADPTFTNPEEAANLLATPVLAVLPANEQCPAAIYPQLPRGTRWSARASEIALAAILFMGLSLVIADESFRSQLLSHPLSSIPHGIERFQDMMQS